MTDVLATSQKSASSRNASLFFLTLSFALGGGLVMGIGAAARAAMTASKYATVSWWQYAFLAAVIAVFVVALLKRIHHRLFWEVVFTTTLFLGVWYAALLILPLGAALAVASILTLGALLLRSVAVHNLFYLIGAAGVALDFAGWLPPEVLVAGLVALTLYDMVAGPPGGPVEKMATELVRRGIIPGLVIPSQLSQLGGNLDAVVKTDAALLGAGDLIVPFTLIAKASFAGLWQAGLVCAGLLLGTLIFGRTGDTHPRAALPALATGTVVPFLILRVLGFL